MILTYLVGVTSLHVLLMREKDEDAPKLHVMLCEALLAVYVTLLVTGLATYDPQILYRLLANKLDQQSWGALFGGGVKTVLKVEKNIPSEFFSPFFVGLRGMGVTFTFSMYLQVYCR